MKAEKVKAESVKTDNIKMDQRKPEPLIGPFFLIGNQLIVHRCPRSMGRKQADKLDNSYGHEQLYDDYIRARFRRKLPFYGMKNVPLGSYTREDADRIGKKRPDRKWIKPHSMQPGDYIDYPRGRVIWNQTADQAIIYLDPCIHTDAVLMRIASMFRLENYTVQYDDHYHCKNCMGNLWD